MTDVVVCDSIYKSRYEITRKNMRHHKKMTNEKLKRKQKSKHITISKNNIDDNMYEDASDALLTPDELKTKRLFGIIRMRLYYDPYYHDVIYTHLKRFDNIYNLIESSDHNQYYNDNIEKLNQDIINYLIDITTYYIHEELSHPNEYYEYDIPTLYNYVVNFAEDTNNMHMVEKLIDIYNYYISINKEEQDIKKMIDQQVVALQDISDLPDDMTNIIKQHLLKPWYDICICGVRHFYNNYNCKCNDDYEYIDYY